MKIITITGTKGKTTITRGIDFVLNKSTKTLSVDSDGYYINGKKKGSYRDSLNLFQLVPTVCPGKFLLDAKKIYPKFTAVLEASLGCSAGPGVGYAFHDIGIFSNVFEDHLGQTKRIKTRMDIAKAKRFVFSRLKINGTAIFNADDKYVCSQLNKIPETRLPVNFLPVGFSFKYFDLKKHLKKGGEYITIENDWVVIKNIKATKKIINIKKIKWTFDGVYLPSLWNVMFIIAAVYIHNDHKIGRKEIKALEEYSMDEEGGRLTLFENKDKVKILIDYAHEKKSLSEVSKILKYMSKGKTIGVVRLAPDRPDNFIYDTGKSIANKFDDIVVYDKIDGVTKKKYNPKKSKYHREAGEVSKILYSGILDNKKKGNVERILYEKNAIKQASRMVQPGDAVVIICGDKHEDTVKWVKTYFDAKLVK